MSSWSSWTTMAAPGQGLLDNNNNSDSEQLISQILACFKHPSFKDVLVSALMPTLVQYGQRLDVLEAKFESLVVATQNSNKNQVTSCADAVLSDRRPTSWADAVQNGRIPRAAAAIPIETKSQNDEEKLKNLLIQGIYGSKEERKMNFKKVAEEKLGILLEDRDFVVRQVLKSGELTLVTFHSMWVRNLIYQRRIKLKGCDIFINEDLNKAQSHLLFKCRMAKKKNSDILRTWTWLGNIFISHANGQTMEIKCETDIPKSSENQAENTYTVSVPLAQSPQRSPQRSPPTETPTDVMEILQTTVSTPSPTGREIIPPSTVQPAPRQNPLQAASPVTSTPRRNLFPEVRSDSIAEDVTEHDSWHDTASNLADDSTSTDINFSGFPAENLSGGENENP